MLYKVFVREVYDTEVMVEAPNAYLAGERAEESAYAGHTESADITWVVEAPDRMAVQSIEVLEAYEEGGEAA